LTVMFLILCAWVLISALRPCSISNTVWLVCSCPDAWLTSLLHICRSSSVMFQKHIFLGSLIFLSPLFIIYVCLVSDACLPTMLLQYSIFALFLKLACLHCSWNTSALLLPFICQHSLWNIIITVFIGVELRRQFRSLVDIFRISVRSLNGGAMLGIF
jgi:hypothetical protein